MPEISRFYGIVIRMFVEAGGPHHVPHFHAYYQGEVAVWRFAPVEMVAGALPLRQRRLVEAWAEIHEVELAANWRALQAGQTIRPIEPLR